MRTKIIRKKFGILIINGIKMRSPATIEHDRPGQLKVIYEPERSGEDGIYKQRRSENSRNTKSFCNVSQ
jgi:hypothetical protein